MLHPPFESLVLKVKHLKFIPMIMWQLHLLGSSFFVPKAAVYEPLS